MRHRIKHLCSFALIVAMLNTAACGYLIYPERQGTRGNRVDGTVVVLDAIGLLFFVVPGVVAFAVDIASGCIYLPEGAKGPFSKNSPPASQPSPEGWVAVAQVAPFADDATIAAALQQHLRGESGDTGAARIEWLPTSGLSAPAHVN